MYVEEKLKEAVEEMRKALINNRNIKYEKGSIGITSLIYCPLKVEMKRKFPELKSEGNAIDDGFIFENTLEPFLEKVFDGKVSKDVAIPYEVDGFKINGHPDFLIEEENKVILLEFKAPIFLFSEGLEEDGEFIVDREGKIKIAESYILQAKIQKFITEKYFRKPVEIYLFIKTILQTRKKGRMSKVYILKPVEDEITEDELKKLIDDFKNKKTPRYKWECSYCVYAKHKKCSKGLLLLKMM